MTSFPNSADALAELGTPVPLPDVEHSLKSIFASDQAVSKASLMNFAIYSERPDSLDRNTALIREVTREHACRALLIGVDPTDQPLDVRCWVTAHCNLVSNSRKSVCSEQITFLINGCSAYLIPNTVFARLDSDLPLVFWWQGEFSDHFEPTLYSRIDRLIVDSSEWSDPVSTFDKLERAHREPISHFSVLDLAWTRVLQIRLALAACFDDPLALAELPLLQEIEITHGQGHGLAARMLAAWMIHRVGWTIRFTSSTQCMLESKEGVPITLNFNSDPGLLPISRIRLKGPNVTSTVTRAPHCPFIKSDNFATLHHTEHLTPANINTPAELVIERLRRGCNNRLYFSLLAIVRKLLN